MIKVTVVPVEKTGHITQGLQEVKVAPDDLATLAYKIGDAVLLATRFLQPNRGYIKVRIDQDEE